MDDSQIIELYLARAQTAISETAEKYGRYCRYIAYNILCSEEDSEECVNDTYLRTWESIPPQRPFNLKAFLGTITRNLSLDRYHSRNAEKRGMGQVPLVLDELCECLPAQKNADDITDSIVLAECLNEFLAGMSEQQRIIFVRRYWYLSPVKEIAADLGYSESMVKMSLLRSRNQLKQALEKEGISL